MTKGGGAPVPDLATGVFPLRPLHPRKIKEETYGKRFVFRGTFIDEGAIGRMVEEIGNDGSLDKLRCLPSFLDFEKYLKICFEEILKLRAISETISRDPPLRSSQGALHPPEPKPPLPPLHHVRRRPDPRPGSPKIRY
ncbi:MAG: hypothetical protein RQM90_12470 [Methanoculleus sp.]